MLHQAKIYRSNQYIIKIKHTLTSATVVFVLSKLTKLTLTVEPNNLRETKMDENRFNSEVLNMLQIIANHA